MSGSSAHLAVGLNVQIGSRVEQLDHFCDVPLVRRALKGSEPGERVVVVDTHFVRGCA